MDEDQSPSETPMKNGVDDIREESPHDDAEYKIAESAFRQEFDEYRLIDMEPIEAVISTTNLLRLRHGMKVKKGMEDAAKFEKHRKIAEIEQMLLDDVKFNNIKQGDLPGISAFFGSSYALNKAFAPPDIIELQTKDPNCFMMNYEKLELFHKRIGELNEKFPEELFVNQIFKEIISVCELMQSKIMHIQSSIQLRLFPILLDFPLYEESDDFLALMELIRTISLLSPEMKQILGSWYLSIPCSSSRQHIAITQQMLTFKILEAQAESGLDAIRGRMAANIRHALAFMQILYGANNIRERECREALSYTEFNNDAINAIPELISHDFRQWLSSQADSDFKLLNHSFILDSSNKALLFMSHAVKLQELQRRNILCNYLWMSGDVNPYLVLVVRRDNIVRDTLQQLAQKSGDASSLKKSLKVKFHGEEGVDEGGVQKEFFQLLVQELFNPDYGMFVYLLEDRICWFNHQSFETESEFRLIGIILGLAIYNGVILDLHFPFAVYKKLLSTACTMKDFEEIQPEIAMSLKNTLKMSPEDLKAAELTFCVSVESFDEVTEVPLGSHSIDQPVTVENREEFVQLFVDWHLNVSIKTQFDAFYKGFSSCCEGGMLQIFRAEDLQLVICGSSDLDFEALEHATQYQFNYTAQSTTIRDFWEIAHEFSLEDKRKLLKFITGSDRVPIKGLSNMKFLIGRNGPTSDKLPTAHTCFNFLLLPDYKNKEKLHNLLKIAIEHHEGFGLR